MQVINGICVLVIIGMFALTVDGKHMQQEAAIAEPHKDVVAEYAAPERDISGLTAHQAVFFAALARHMGRTR